MTSRNSQGGFTLVEILVVIAIMGATLLLITHYIQPHSRALETEAAARQVADAMRAARGRAIASGHDAAFALPKLPGWMQVAVNAPKGGIVFSPDGSASGGTVILAEPQAGDPDQPPARTIAISADWLTGRVQINGP